MLGEELKKERTRIGISQEELAYRAQVHRTYISLLERNVKSPTVEVLSRICNALNIKPSTILKRLGQ